MPELSVLHKRPQWLWLGLALSTAVHLIVVVTLISYRTQIEEMAQRFRFRAPTLPRVFWKPPRQPVRALEFRKRPVPRGAYLADQTSLTEPHLKALAAYSGEQIMGSLRSAELAHVDRARVVRSGEIGDGLRGPRARRPDPHIGNMPLVRPEPQEPSASHLDLRLDMLDIWDLDTGEYQALVIQDPNDRRNVRGFIHLGQVHPVAISEFLQGASWRGIVFTDLTYLVKALEEYTGIEAQTAGMLRMDDPRLLETPWLKMIFFPEEAQVESECRNLGRYLTGGGFIVTQLPRQGSEKTSGQDFDLFRAAMRTQGLNEGSDWRFEWLGPSHPVYHAFFDFDMSVQIDGSQTLKGDMGLFIGDYLAVLFTQASTLVTAAGVARVSSRGYIDATRLLQFAVNTVVFALTQEGSITQQRMAGVR